LHGLKNLKCLGYDESLSQQEIEGFEKAVPSCTSYTSDSW